MRRYGTWAGNPQGRAEDIALCIAQVNRGGVIGYQCSRRRGHGPDEVYCKQHAGMIERGRHVYVPREKSE